MFPQAELMISADSDCMSRHLLVHLAYQLAANLALDALSPGKTFMNEGLTEIYQKLKMVFLA